MELTEEVWQVAQQQQLWKKGSKVLIAVSGGPDSMALMHILHTLAQRDELTLIVAHVNHGFRFEESAAEYELVKQQADKLLLPFEYIELNMPEYLQENQVNSQAASRERRYQFFHEACLKHAATYVALAHHGDDQAETVFMHMLRGTGLTGLSGMAFKRQEKNVELIRPLLRMKKDSLISYCLEKQVPYLIDSSNEKRDYFRNEVRLDVIPYLEKFNPKFADSLARLADVAGEENDWMELQAQQLFVEHVKTRDRSMYIACNALIELHVALQRRVIKLILSYLSQEATSISFEGIERIRWAAGQTVASTYRFDVGEGIVCLREYNKLRFVHIKDYSVSHLTNVELLTIKQQQLPCDLAFGSWSVSAKVIENCATAPQPSSRYEAIFDYDLISFPIVLRSRETGDRMNVLGLNGSKKVQDMFVDAKIAASDRDTYPIVLDQSMQILWVPGIRRSNQGLVGQKTRTYLVMTCRRDNHNRA